MVGEPESMKFVFAWTEPVSRFGGFLDLSFK